MAAFIGLRSKKSASFVVIKERRRIGKSRLVEELSKHFICGFCLDGLKEWTAKL
ncbi:MAG: hypothetical protein WCG10_03550 [Chlamydiota bacterium]